MRARNLKDIYWSAGFLEGEGCFGWNNGGIVVRASQKQPEPLQRLQNLYGGKIYSIKHSGRLETYNEWALFGKDSIGLAMTIYPLMSSKRKEKILSLLKIWKNWDKSRSSNNNQKKTHCPQGHPYDLSNTYIYKNPIGQISRHCKRCNREWKRNKGGYFARSQPQTRIL